MTQANSPKQASAPRVPFALLVTGLVVGGMALLLVLNTASAANELRRHDLADRDSVIAARLQDLRQAVAVSAAPGNLAAAAAALGMVPAGDPAFLVIGADGKVTMLGKPGPATEPPVAVPPSKAPAKKAPKPGTSSAKTVQPTAKASTKAGHSTTSTSPKRHAGATKSASASPPSTPTSTPTPTPTPTVTLPGGTR